MDTNNSNKISHTNVNGFSRTSMKSWIGVESVEVIIAKTDQDGQYIGEFTGKMLMKAANENTVDQLNQKALLN